jgi:hypothetical protein
VNSLRLAALKIVYIINPIRFSYSAIIRDLSLHFTAPDYATCSRMHLPIVTVLLSQFMYNGHKLPCCYPLLPFHIFQKLSFLLDISELCMLITVYD